MTPLIATQLLLMAKAPVPGRVKTRLCPPCTPRQAASIAAAALADTFANAGTFPAARHTLVLAGDYGAPAGWHVVAQRGDGLGQRIANAFHDTALPGAPSPHGAPSLPRTLSPAETPLRREIASLLIGMDTPQVTDALLADVAAGLAGADAVVAPATDGGWWALALRDPRHGMALATVPMSTSETGARTAAALRDLGLRVAYGPELRDVDLAEDARDVAASCPDSAFAEAIRRHLPALQPR